MFSCFGTKSSSQENISTKRSSSVRRKEEGFRQRVEVTEKSIFSFHRAAVDSITHFRSGQRRNVLPSLIMPRSSRLRTDAIPFREPNLERTIVTPRWQEPSTSRNISVNNSRFLSVPPARTSTENVNKYKVKRTFRLYDVSENDKRPVYQTHSDNRGQVLLINNVKFCNKGQQRRGAEKDEKDLIDVLNQIGFKVENYRNIKKSETQKILRNFTSQKNLKKADICLVVFMSHGTNNNIPGGYTEILCADSKTIATEEIIDYFNESRCTLLKDKPKIFIFQCCRNTVERDALPLSRKPQDKSNTLIAYSTIPGFPSNRNPEKGTWYIQTICKVFSEHAHEYHIEDLLKLVDIEMRRIDPDLEQVSCYENRGFARCYLHPINK